MIKIFQRIFNTQARTDGNGTYSGTVRFSIKETTEQVKRVFKVDEVTGSIFVRPNVDASDLNKDIEVIVQVSLT